MTEPLFLGLDIGGTTCAVVLGDAGGVVVARVEIETRAERGPEAILEELFEAARGLRERSEREVAACGVAVGGPLDVERGVVLGPPNLPGWDEVPLRERAEAALGLPVAIEHDAAACALAEARWGAGRGARRVAYLTCGSGFGLGWVVDGRADHGAGGRSLEIGHVRYRDDGPRAFGKSGSFEAFCAGNALPGLAAWLFPERWKTSPPDGAALGRLAREGDEAAARVIEVNATAVGDACALLGDLLGPDTIVLGSLARYLGERWVSVVRRRFEAQVQRWVAAHCSVVPAALGGGLQDRSALVVAVACDILSP